MAGLFWPLAARYAPRPNATAGSTTATTTATTTAKPDTGKEGK